MSEMDGQNGEHFPCEVYEHFSGTKVPKKSLFDHLAAGGTLDSFMALFPAVSRERAEAVLVQAQMKQDQTIKAGKPVANLYAAYLEAVNGPVDERFRDEAVELVNAFQDVAAFREIAKAKGFLLDQENFEALALEQLVPDERATRRAGIDE